MLFRSIFSSAYLQPKEIENHAAKVIVVDEENRIAERLSYASGMDAVEVGAGAE